MRSEIVALTASLTNEAPTLRLAARVETSADAPESEELVARFTVRSDSLEPNVDVVEMGWVDASAAEPFTGLLEPFPVGKDGVLLFPRGFDGHLVLRRRPEISQTVNVDLQIEASTLERGERVEGDHLSLEVEPL